jgi:predicted dehydrogenase
MIQERAIVGFVGAGGIARAHAYSLNSLRYYYDDAPQIELAAVCSARAESRESFAKRFGFIRALNSGDFFADKMINTVYILGPNEIHYQHLKSALEMNSLKRVYLEKPVCSNLNEEVEVNNLADSHTHINIQVGFQYLFSAAIREALVFWKSGILGNPIHFEIKYYHSDYLKKEYRDKRTTRLTPAPDGGAMADLGSHAISLLIAFFGNNIQITGALQSGHFDDVTEESDLFSQISLYDKSSMAVGTLSASRISAGTADDIAFEFYCEKGALRYSTSTPDYYEYFTERSHYWVRQMTGSHYKPFTSFPSGHVPPGWLRSMIHADYIFLKKNSVETLVPDINHGLAVQRLVRETAEHLNKFRKIINH